MATDPFAAIRKCDTGNSTSFAAALEHPEHHESEVVFLEKRLISAAATPGTPGTPLFDDQTDDRPVASIRVIMPDVVDRDYLWLPDSWRDGLIKLNRMSAPSGATDDRWRQIVQDAHWLAWEWHADPDLAIWSTEDLFGYDPDAPAATSLCLAMRGERVTNLLQVGGLPCAVIEGAEGRRQHWRTHKFARLIWDLESEE